MPPEGDGSSATDGDKGDKGEGGKAPGADEAAQLLASFKESGLESPAKALELIKDLRSFEKGDKLPPKIAQQLKDLQKQVSDAENAKLSDAERLQKRIDDLEQKGQASEQKALALVRNAAIVSAAREAGAIDPDAMPLLIDADAVTYDANGTPTNVPELIAALKAGKPVWFSEGGPGSFDGGARGSGGGKEVGMEQALRAAAGH